MRIGIDVRPLIGQRAGIGYYVYGLLIGLNKRAANNEFYLYADNDFEINLPNLKIHKKVIKNSGILWHFLVVLDILINKIDLYHSTHSFIIPVILGNRTITTFLDASSILFAQTHSLKVKFLGRLLFSLAAKRTGKVLAISQSTKNDIIKIAKVNKDKISVIYCAVDDSYRPIPNESVKKILSKYNLPARYLLYNATLEPRKNPLRLIEAYYQLKTKHPKMKPLVMVGKKGWLYEEIFELVKKLRLGKDVIFTNWVPDEDLPALYSGALILVYPSLFEGFGLSLLKAFACGTPVVTSKISSMPEVSRGAAILVDPYDSGDIATAVWKVISNKKLADDLRKKGFERVKKFSWQRTARKTLEVYRQSGR
ncbi:MAG: Glycosyl transferase group 1 [Candidatus Daviesbacteria bacterium GW2011_GWA1_41_61]|uniref:Glycosyl transferase group 1 n=1 Tax=Candidatus Daviesbacteria bacterium GW2011_GWA2_40_9 TaxID=1618424 RepID=A0A0G0X7U7_9BACT|nr:MAG: Glycosyl transferase group 1 [Candidatus Daviesbacteria bacterium GW2011_GWA2_40_9]KKR93693.1 MAG: Glycosyl transferase group 1 [Candidatus Daviesbacteria bacterium GW2011_GWB1_41_15]KKS15159.1 MAG: Glycosyl transferase group 1 [Candidatus Daviesbacteria bacterium GW2011_GWA1_41_61]